LALATFAAISVQADTICRYAKVEDYSVEVDGYEWRHVKYGWACETTTSGGSTTVPNPSPVPPTPAPSISIISLSDLNPRQLMIGVTGNASVTSTEVLLNGRSISLLPGYITDGASVAGPNLASMPVGPAKVTVRACAPDGRCTSTYFDIYRGMQGSGTSNGFTATWVESENGTTVVRLAAYNYSLGEEPITTAYYGVEVAPKQTRIQFGKTRTTVSYYSNQRLPYPMFTARHWVRNLGPQYNPTLYKSYQSMYSCSPSLFGGGDTFISVCGTASGFGETPMAGTDLTSLQVTTDSGLAPATYVNGTISYVIP
jgi:hypothetical protein